jgi:hypothetical protein
MIKALGIIGALHSVGEDANQLQIKGALHLVGEDANQLQIRIKGILSFINNV